MQNDKMTNINNEKFLQKYKILFEQVTQSPNSPKLLARLGDVCLEMGRRDEALFNYQKALALDHNLKDVEQKIKSISGAESLKQEIQKPTETPQAKTESPSQPTPTESKQETAKSGFFGQLFKQKTSAPAVFDLENMKKQLRSWGIVLIILGVIHIAASNILDPVWGGGIIATGILNLIIMKRGMFIVNGCALVLVGVLNIIGNVGAKQISFWILLGVMQIVWGIQEIRKFSKFKQT